MNEFTASELQEAIDEHWGDDYVKEAAFGDYYEFWANYGCNEACSKPFDLPGFGTVESVAWQGMHNEVSGGYNGDYSVWKIYTVIKVGERTFARFGEDDSWGGSTGLDSLIEVEPVQKIVTVWEKKHDY